MHSTEKLLVLWKHMHSAAHKYVDSDTFSIVMALLQQVWVLHKYTSAIL